MNIIGPYASSQLLLHPFKIIIQRETARQNDQSVTTGLVDVTSKEEKSRPKTGPWSWTAEAEMGPATTWPLGEVLMARHDMQHSRIFNS
jgi:urease accessory protein